MQVELANGVASLTTVDHLLHPQRLQQGMSVINGAISGTKIADCFSYRECFTATIQTCRYQVRRCTAGQRKTMQKGRKKVIKTERRQGKKRGRKRGRWNRRREKQKHREERQHKNTQRKGTREERREKERRGRDRKRERKEHRGKERRRNNLAYIYSHIVSS